MQYLNVGLFGRNAACQSLARRETYSADNLDVVKFTTRMGE